MGTPAFAVPVLRALAERHEIAAVYTRADKPSGRGRALAESPVKRLALELGLLIEQPRTLRNAQAVERLREYAPDLIVVAAYGLILPQDVLDLPRFKCINTHASLLPRWRGASPISEAILAGDEVTGVTLMQMDAGVDTGPIIRSEEMPIDPQDTTASLTLKLSELAARLITSTLPDWVEGRLTPVPQQGEPTFTHMIKKEEGLIDWTRPAYQIERAVRAYNPWPSAYTFFHTTPDRSMEIKIWRAHAIHSEELLAPGTVFEKDLSIGITCGQGTLLPLEVQLAGKRAISIVEFLRGQRAFVGSRLGRE
jgi:methionyl-tRNA formyltransferase